MDRIGTEIYIPLVNLWVSCVCLLHGIPFHNKNAEGCVVWVDPVVMVFVPCSVCFWFVVLLVIMFQCVCSQPRCGFPAPHHTTL